MTTLWKTSMLLTLTLGLAGSPIACDSGDDDEAERQAVADALRGTWLTACLPTGQDAWGTFSFTNAGETGSFTYTMHADDTCSFALAEFTLYSHQHVGALVPSAGPDARELDVLYDRLTATALVDDLAVAFTQAGCGAADVVVGEEIDISDTGCFTFKSIADCPADYDIMAIDADDRYYNGVRTANMCVTTGRPTELNSFPFLRIE